MAITKQMTTIRLEQETLDRLRAVKEETGIPIARIVRDGVKKRLDEVEQNDC